MNWQGLNQWQQWALGIGCSLAAALLIWLCTKLFGHRKGTESMATIQQTASPVMTQNFQPTINIHTAGAGAATPPPDPSLRVKLAIAFLTYGPELSDEMLLFKVANPGDKPVQLTSIRVLLKSGESMVFPYLQGQRPLPCFVDPYTSLNFWVKLSDVEESIRRRNYTGAAKIHAVATDALNNEHVSNSVEVGH